MSIDLDLLFAEAPTAAGLRAFPVGSQVLHIRPASVLEMETFQRASAALEGEYAEGGAHEGEGDQDARTIELTLNFVATLIVEEDGKTPVFADDSKLKALPQRLLMRLMAAALDHQSGGDVEEDAEGN